MHISDWETYIKPEYVLGWVDIDGNPIIKKEEKMCNRYEDEDKIAQEKLDAQQFEAEDQEWVQMTREEEEAIPFEEDAAATAEAQAEYEQMLYERFAGELPLPPEDRPKQLELFDDPDWVNGGEA
jgi:hypothetical protein